MGLHSSCSVFEQLSAALHWIAVHHLGIAHMVHLTDDLFVVSASHSQGQEQLHQFIQLRNEIQVPVASAQKKKKKKTCAKHHNNCGGW